MSRKTVLILSFSSLNSDPRILRQVSALKDDYNIETCAFAPINDDSIPFYQIYTEPKFSLVRKIKRLLQFLLRFYDKYYWDLNKINLTNKLQNKKYDAIIANDIITLPLALAISANKSKIYFDAHEYHPKEFEDNLMWNLFHRPYIEFLCKKYIPKADAFSTVAKEIANEYNKFLNVLPLVITNASYYSNIEPSKTENGNIKLIHHGAAIKGRQIENMINLMKLVDKRFSLYLMLTGKGSFYYNSLMKLASLQGNIYFLEPVPFNQIIETINKYDVGIYILPPTNFNNMNALPNKFFEFIQAKLALAISPNIEMSNIVREFKVGKVSASYSTKDMAKLLNSLTSEDIITFKKSAQSIAKIICAEENLKIIKQIIRDLISE